MTSVVCQRYNRRATGESFYSSPKESHIVLTKLASEWPSFLSCQGTSEGVGFLAERSEVWGCASPAARHVAAYRDALVLLVPSLPAILKTDLMSEMMKNSEAMAGCEYF